MQCRCSDPCDERKPCRKARLALGFVSAFVTTLLTLVNLSYLDYSSPTAPLFLFAQLVWFYVMLNHSATFVRLAFYQEPRRDWSLGGEPPLVSIIAPIYKEPVGLLLRFLEGLARQSYPPDRFEIIVVDDSPPEHSRNSRAAALEYASLSGIKLRYIIREDRRGYKGGAVRRGIEEAAGKYIVVMDIDHRPLPHMLEEMVAVAEANPGFDAVMFPQCFPLPRNSVENACHVGQLFDYSFSRKGKSVTNSAFCVGTNWIARRGRVLEAGGYDDETIVEDMATGLKKWHPAGLRLGFAEGTLAVGTVPSTLSAWRVQQYRWAYGTFTVLPEVLRRMRSLSFFQAVDYLYTVVWYMVGPAILASHLLPFLVALGFNLLSVPSPIVYLVVIVGFTGLQIAVFAAPLILEGESPARVLLCQATGLLVADVYARAMVDALLGRRRGFKVTPKEGAGRKPLREVLRETAVPLFLAALNVAAIGVSVARDRMPYVVAPWAAYNLAWIAVGVGSYLRDVYWSGGGEQVAEAAPICRVMPCMPYP